MSSKDILTQTALPEEEDPIFTNAELRHLADFLGALRHDYTPDSHDTASLSPISPPEAQQDTTVIGKMRCVASFTFDPDPEKHLVGAETNDPNFFAISSNDILNQPLSAYANIKPLIDPKHIDEAFASPTGSMVKRIQFRNKEHVLQFTTRTDKSGKKTVTVEVSVEAEKSYDVEGLLEMYSYDLASMASTITLLTFRHKNKMNELFVAVSKNDLQKIEELAKELEVLGQKMGFVANGMSELSRSILHLQNLSERLDMRFFSVEEINMLIKEVVRELLGKTEEYPESLKSQVDEKGLLVFVNTVLPNQDGKPIHL